MASIRLILSLLLMLPFVAVMAQVPGFMGKRASLMIEANPTPALLNMNMNNSVTTEWGEPRTNKVNLLAFNIRPQVNFEYLVGKKTALGLHYQQIITGTVKDIAALDYEYEAAYYDVLRGDAAGLFIKFYRFKKSAAIAPLGYYTSLTATMARVNTYNQLNDKQKQFGKDLHYPVISWGWGKQFMPVPNLLIGTGAEIGLAMKFMNKEDNSLDPGPVSMQEVDASMLGYYLFNFKLSVGYMLF